MKTKQTKEIENHNKSFQRIFILQKTAKKHAI